MSHSEYHQSDPSMGFASISRNEDMLEGMCPKTIISPYRYYGRRSRDLDKDSEPRVSSPRLNTNHRSESVLKRPCKLNLQSVLCSQLLPGQCAELCDLQHLASEASPIRAATNIATTSPMLEETM